MQRKILGFMMSILFVFTLCSGAALAGQKEDTLDLVKKGREFVQKNGIEKAVEALKTPEFKKGDLYIFVYDYKGTCLAHGGIPTLVGKNLWDMKTPTGKMLLRDMVEISKKGGGWYDYEWNHETKKVLMGKESFIQPIDGMEAFAACGFYKE